MQIVPVLAIPNQSVQTTLDNQVVNLNIRQLRYGLFMDVYVGGVQGPSAVICKNQTLIIRDGYWDAVLGGFSGDFIFNDLFGTTDPVYTGLGTRYQLIYLLESELQQLGVTTE